MTHKGDIRPERALTGGSSYPPPHDEKLKGRKTWPLAGQWKLTQFGVNRVELPPGAWSTNRHWHRTNDELVVVISGELVLVTDDGEEVLRAGDCVGFKAGVPNAHHLQNRGTGPAVYYDIGGRDAWDVSTFPDIGLEARSHMEIRFREIGPRT
ncbi:cupin domain-containing protein [Novosphingobium album (ex Liu et al. 2023)]|uniref:Cupin domain-containing protein n=1 Tax=Novosphingobium album (ex Liu et al. 2023) TaxID=3031130 RepID=A0ABT5WUE5_9SPHN|nr:cupin domain-containing protein [Novosphingobium album (ex Liu et al. 2023)]MDE8653525.1 cupin domain-containing protein [Novosphingobium album (ex Liu et al. 2023)]